MSRKPNNKKVDYPSCDKYGLRKRKVICYSLTRRNKRRSDLSYNVKTEFDDHSYDSLHSIQYNCNNIPDLNFKKLIKEEIQNQPFITVKQEPVSPTKSDVLEDVGLELAERIAATSLTIKKELLDESASDNAYKNTNFNKITERQHFSACNDEQPINKPMQKRRGRKPIHRHKDKQINNVLIAEPVVKIKQEPLSPTTNSDVINTANDETFQENCDVKIKQEPLESNELEGFNFSDSFAESSITVKKELLDDHYAINTLDNTDTNESNLIETKISIKNVVQSNMKKKKAKSNVNSTTSSMRKNKQNEEYDHVQYTMSPTESSESNDVSSLVKYKTQFINPFCVLKKKLLIKEEELSESEKNKIELEKDRRCREISKRTGQKWRRVQIQDETLSENIRVPKLQDVIVVFTPAGQRCELYPNFDRPDEFPCEEDRQQWDSATTININRNIYEIENGYFVPLGVYEKREQDFKKIMNEADQVYTKKAFVISDSLFVSIEHMFLKLDCWIKTRLPDNANEISAFMNDVIAVTFPEFLFIKHPQILRTMIQMMKQDEYQILKYKASLIYRKIQLTFSLFKPNKLEEFIFDAAENFQNTCRHLSFIEYMMITPNSIDETYEEILDHMEVNPVSITDNIPETGVSSRLTDTPEE